jgi:hypothetical protein
MLQNASSRARTAIRNAHLHSRLRIVQQQLSALKWAGTAGHQSSFSSTNRNYSKRLYSSSQNDTASYDFATTLPLRSTASRDSAAAIGNDTIYALSTAPGRAGIAIVRISGPSCMDVSFALLFILFSLTLEGLQRPLPVQATRQSSICLGTNTLRPPGRIQRPRR